MNETCTTPNFWDNFSGSFRIQPPLEKLEKIAAKDSVILDIGCGYGRILNSLSEAGYKNLYGIDTAGNMIERAKREFPALKNTVKKVDDAHIPFPDHTFDAVLLVAVLTCIPDDVDQQLLMQEVKRVLKPGGLLLLSDFLITDNEINLARYEKYKDALNCYGVFKMDNDEVVFRHHRLDYLKGLLSEFNILDETSEIYTSMRGTPDRAVHIIAEIA